MDPIRLTVLSSTPLGICPHCHHVGDAIHRRGESDPVQDLPLGPQSVELLIRTYQFSCPPGGHFFTPAAPVFARGAHATERFLEQAARALLCGLAADYAYGRSYPHQWMSKISGQEVTRVLFHLTEPGEFKDLDKYFASDHEWASNRLPRVDLQLLEVDPALQRRIPIHFNEPTVHDFLHFFERTSGLTMTAVNADAAENPVIGGVGYFGLSLWQIMQDLAVWKTVQGRWDRTPTGYQLVVLRTRSPDQVKESAPPVPVPHFALPPWLSVLLVNLALAGVLAFLYLRQRRAKPS